MTYDRTQPQSTEDQAQSQDLSRTRTAPPLQIEGYEPRQFLGAGAFGEVWVAIDRNTGRRVAIKFYMHRSGLDWSMLSREVEKLVFLSADRHVVQLLDVGWDATPPYYVMEYVENGSLEDYLRREGPRPVGEAVELFRKVAIGLSRAHGKGVLHCDLKPANILLDQDHLPRLADFGQSRLSHEQTPALGTLFFMAPEQADLTAVPDARWDVYALGALLHCLLTGVPPHRSAQAVSEIDSTNDLTRRLQHYRHFIEHAPPLTEVRQVKGMDRALQEILERCLAVDPERRYPNVQSVIDALEKRDALRDRKPLMILGLLGPLLFLLITSFFAWRSHQQAVGDADRLLLLRAQESNRFAADFVSEAVARRIESYFRAVEATAGDRDLQQELAGVLDQPELAAYLVSARGRDPREEWPERQQFRAHPARQRLQELMERLLDDAARPEIASWFVTDAHGIHLATAVDTPEVRSPIGGDFSYRTYFHGGPADVRPAELHAIERTHFSAVFRSTTTLSAKVAISTPVRDPQRRLLGVLAFTVELGRLNELLANKSNPHQFNVLVDGRPGENRGVILQHPLFDYLLQEQEQLDDDLVAAAEYRVPLDQLREGELYQDPLGRHPAGKSFQRHWVAAKREVWLDPHPGQAGSTPPSVPRGEDTGLVVLVQENYDLAAAPVHQLGDSLLRQGIAAASTLVVLVVILWYAVARALGDPNETVRRHGGLRTLPSTIHSMETIELPERMRR